MEAFEYRSETIEFKGSEAGFGGGLVSLAALDDVRHFLATAQLTAIKQTTIKRTMVAV